MNKINIDKLTNAQRDMLSVNMKNTIAIEGFTAIEYAETHDLTLSKYNDPTEDARDGLTPGEARAVAREDACLIYLTLHCHATHNR